MAIISLRAYNREIEGLIDNGQLDEAVAHCRYILATFPKHIATYRLLGKAHLEQQRISDATDIFQRVLSAIPDDFIANVGMSIIREDENNLDAAIWHMELAYEAQPANIAIQDELRRLYGRRDGMQPPKVRLTRGALARMYAKGGLFDQAIAELRGAIAEDPNRPDLQLLLAQMFFQTSQRVEAVDVCVNILKKMPLCLEANRILTVSLPVAEGSDAVKNSRQIVISMDPYYAFAEPEAISSDQVPETAVNIERLEYKSGIQIGEVPNQPAWATSLGINMEKPAEENIPEWLKAAEAPAPKQVDDKTSPTVSPFIWDTQEVEKIITDTSKPEGEIPDWMKDAGWKPASGEAVAQPDKILPPEEPTVASPASEDLQQADIPEWLRGIAPGDFAGQQGQQAQPEEDTLSNPWLEPHQPGPTDSIIHWLEDKPSDTSVTPQAQEQNIAFSPDDEVPDWLKDLDLPQTSTPEVENPEETSPAFTSLPSAFLGEPSTSATSEIEATPIEQAAESTTEPPSIQAELPTARTAEESEQPPVSAGDEIPDWLKDVGIAVTTAEVISSVVEKPPEETPPVTEPEPAAHMVAAEIPLVAETESTEQPPTAEAPAVTESEPAVQPVVEETTTVIEPQPGEQPSAFESPAEEARLPVAEGEPTEELLQPEEAPAESKLPLAAAAILTAEALTKPEETSVEEQSSVIETVSPTEVPGPTEPEVILAAPIAADIASTETPQETEVVPSQEPPLQASDEPQIDQLIPAEAEIPPAEPDSMNEAAAFAWLEGLAAEQDAKEEGLVATPSEGELQPPDWVKLDMEPNTEEVGVPESPVVAEESVSPAEEVPDWIKGLGEEPETEPASEPAESVAIQAGEAPTISPASGEVGEENLEELPDWLLEMEKPEEEKEAPAQYNEALEWQVEELPDWLKEITESEAAGEAVPAEQHVTPAEIAAAAAIAGLSKTEETPPPAETVAQPVVLPQPEAPMPIQAEAEPAPVAEEVQAEAVETNAVKPQEPVPFEAVQEPLPVQAVVQPDPAEAVLSGARTALNLGDSSQALGLYSRLINQNYRLDEIIKDLKDALYRYPVDVDMWVTLGDAHSHTKDLQEALNAYTKAEELAR
jgi:tetratricopeptide (TPR) repeat protein